MGDIAIHGATVVTMGEDDRLVKDGTVRAVDGELLVDDGTVRSMDVDSVRAAATRERKRLQTETGWETSLAGSSPPDTSIRRRVSVRPLLRAVKLYGRGFVNQRV